MALVLYFGLSLSMYDTPAHLAKHLLRHVPKHMTRVLEPAIGRGALISPLLSRLEKHKVELVCVDTHTDSLNEVNKILKHRKIKATYINDDFLNWAPTQTRCSFDYILMNPPFAGIRTAYRTLDEYDGQPIARMPVEAAFVYAAQRLLSPGGRMLAILPCSVIMSESLAWLRTLLFETGSIDYVYEFPVRTFKTVDSKVFLLVFRKGHRKSTRLIKSDGDLSKSITLRNSSDGLSRLDYGYHEGISHWRELQRHTALAWRPLGEVARIFRGTMQSAPRDDNVVHSTNFVLGRWRPPKGKPIERTKNGRLQDSDLLVRRVGRNNHRTLGSAQLVAGLYATDCLFVIRPRGDICSQRLHFALYSVFLLDWLPAFLERGTGASYYSKNTLELLPVPLEAARVFSDAFRQFSRSLITNQSAFASMTQCLTHLGEAQNNGVACLSKSCPLLGSQALDDVAEHVTWDSSTMNGGNLSKPDFNSE